MKLKSIHLEHFRCFESFDLELDDQLTVLVGENGAGKTAVLEALSIFLKWWAKPAHGGHMFAQISTADVQYGYEPEDVKLRYDLVESSGQGRIACSIELVYFSSGDKTVFLANQIEMPSIELLREDETSVFAAYMTDRFTSDNDFILPERTQKLSEIKQTDGNFSRKIDYGDTILWFNDTDADEARAMRDSNRKEEFPELKAVREALNKALLGKYERPSMMGTPPELVIYEKGSGHVYKVSQLSDGYRAMLALVMDLARRMAQAPRSMSSDGESILHTSAIVLIDEVELHLHPSWQQTVLLTLMDIFPNTQFIVTTHSPQVLSAIQPKHIRILSDGKAYSVEEQTQGAEASRLLKSIFRVELRPKDLEIVKALKKYSKMVYDEKWDTPEAVELKKTLTDHYGNDEPVMMELDLHVENALWERGL